MTAKRARQLLRSLKGLPPAIQEINALWTVVRYLIDAGQQDIAEELSRAFHRVDISRAEVEGVEIEQ